ncbi:MAG: bifunctional hydroxymethylpyrimidine kinase/phosphomethylpyrimidine kinase [Dehalococcoidia bacterium]
MTNKLNVFKAMTIAGSDSGAGAGIQADLKTFAAHGVYGTSVLTAITAQNTLGVNEIVELPVSIIEGQFNAVMNDINTDVIKIGMLSSVEIIECVNKCLSNFPDKKLVLDPVMVAKGGDALLKNDAINSLISLLIPRSFIVTPNAPEASSLTNIDVIDIGSAKQAALKLYEMGASNVVIKGGHLHQDNASDIFFDGNDFYVFSVKRVETLNTHGTGCTFASAIASGIAKQKSLNESVKDAKDYVFNSILNNFQIGKGHGPLNHFYKFWNFD